VRRFILTLAAAVFLVLPLTAADLEGIPVVSVEFEPSSQPLLPERLEKLVLVQPGTPLDLRQVSESIHRLFATGRYTEIAADAAPVEGGVKVTFLTKRSYFIGGVDVTGVSGPPSTIQLANAANLTLGDPYWPEDIAVAQQNMRQVPAANASSINDGGAAVVLMSAERAEREGRPVLGRIRAWGGAARAPIEFTIAPADAIRTTLARAKLSTKDVDLWEINEAFAVVSVANNRLLDLDARSVNVRGGAVALGHPIGASGARILVTLLHAMKDLGKRRGLASLCIGGGEAVAVVVER
jgi:hypothetical protein